MAEPEEKEYDLITFVGQSNMGGRGAWDSEHPVQFPKLIPGAGYEYHAVSFPTTMRPLKEPFGAAENRVGGIYDVRKGVPCATGSMVTAFANAWYENTGRAVIAVSASRGGSRIAEWVPGTPYYEDCKARILAANSFIRKNAHKVKHSFIVYLQGERDARIGTPSEEYEKDFLSFWNNIKKDCGVGKLFIIPIGNFNIPGLEDRMDRIRSLQHEIAAEHDDIEVASELLKDMRERGLMKDGVHYYQEAYNIVGTDAATNISRMI